MLVNNLLGGGRGPGVPKFLPNFSSDL